MSLWFTLCKATICQDYWGKCTLFIKSLKIDFPTNVQTCGNYLVKLNSVVHFLGRIQQLVRGFAADWKKSIENINQEIMRSFSNFKNGTTILQVSKTW